MNDAEGLGAEGQGLPRLPPGRHGLPREFVVENQRQRLAAGIIQVVAERGYHDATVTDVAAAAGVSRRTFYGYFDSKAECFSDTYEMVVGFLLGAMAEAGESEARWAARVKRQIEALLAAYAANPDLATFTLLAPPAAGAQVADRYRRFLQRLLAALVEGRPGNVRHPSAAAEQALAGGLAAVIAAKVEAGEGAQLPALLPDLTELVLVPYLGRERALAESRSG